MNTTTTRSNDDIRKVKFMFLSMLIFGALFGILQLISLKGIDLDEFESSRVDSIIIHTYEQTSITISKRTVISEICQEMKQLNRVDPHAPNINRGGYLELKFYMHDKWSTTDIRILDNAYDGELFTNEHADYKNDKLYALIDSLVHAH